MNINKEAIEKRLDEMSKNLDELPRHLWDTFENWQKDDLNRKHPETIVTDQGVSTIIRPRSRKQTAVGLKILRRRQGRTRPRSNRPILREELREMLRERLRELGKDLTWR